jgi:lysophospholipase L1-like esterase
MKTIRWFSVVVFLGVLGILSLRVGADDSTTRPEGKIRIVLAGDSTTQVGSGWGPSFMKCLSGDVECINMARGGRSSKSFIAEGLWKKCLDLKPDYILIQFGHNDQPGHGADRETDPDTTYRQFMTQYVDDARAAGIKPILITPLSRRQWGADGKIHSTLVPNARVVKEIAAEKHVPLIDLHSLSIQLYEQIGKDGCNELSPLKDANASKHAKNADDNGVNPVSGEAPATQPAGPKVYDGTHLNPKGSAIIGAIVAGELAKVVPDLAPYIKLPANRPALPGVSGTHSS